MANRPARRVHHDALLRYCEIFNPFLHQLILLSEIRTVAIAINPYRSDRQNPKTILNGGFRCEYRLCECRDSLNMV